ncbi:MAG TPA: hypothetical protein VK173_11420 [Lacibacter sp.]|nr:hypothetical protein [Lacibacter sp.]
MEQLTKPEIPHKKKRIKVLRPSQIIKKQRDIYPFADQFEASFGKPERHAKWFITGPSYSGKSSFIFTLCNYLTQFGIVDYNNHEEAGGDSETVASKIRQSGMADKDGKVRLYKAPIESETHETYFERLNRKKSADFGVLDSMQHAELNKKSYLHLTDKLCTPKKGKSLLFVSHYQKNDFTLFVKHDCDIKIEVINFTAHIESRYGGNKVFVIWLEGAKKAWGKKFTSVVNGNYWPGRKK